MKKKIFRILVGILFLFVISNVIYYCNGYDCKTDLSGGYFYYYEQKDILCGGDDEIPPYVIDYNYNKNFIIAKQKPKFPQDIIYKSYHYKNGEDSTYYWLIVHSEKLVLGPLDSIEYLNYRIKYNVPEKLKFKK